MERWRLVTAPRGRFPTWLPTRFFVRGAVSGLKQDPQPAMLF